MRTEERLLLYQSLVVSLLLHLLSGLFFWMVHIPAADHGDTTPLMVRFLSAREVPRFFDQPDAPRATREVTSRDISQVTSEARGPGKIPGPITVPERAGSGGTQRSQPPAQQERGIGGSTLPSPRPRESVRALPPASGQATDAGPTPDPSLPSDSRAPSAPHLSLREQIAALGTRGLEAEGTPLDPNAEGTTGTDERIVSLETQGSEVAPYLAEVKRQIERHWVTPGYARAIGLAGKLVVVFSITPEGDLARLEISESSGTSILDEAAVEAVTEAAPYAPFPPTFTFHRLTIIANFAYVDTSGRVRQPQ